MADNGVDQGYDPRTGRPVGAPVPHTGGDALDRTCQAAAAAAPWLAALAPGDRAAVLESIADALATATDELVALADAETALGAARLSGELVRTQVQLAMYAAALREGSFLEVVIDLPDPAAQPAPRPDLRRMLVPVGPVAVYAAGNFPLAFSVAGTDTASALAAGCPVVVKAHPGHPRLAARTGELTAAALSSLGAPPGCVGVVHGLAAGRALVQHPAMRAAAFTGSLAGGRALAELAAGRPDPIPFYGELGALNPVVVTPAAASARAGEIARGFAASLLLGSGQFCTKPGLVFVPAGFGLAELLAGAVAEGAAAEPGPMLTGRQRDAFQDGAAKLAELPGVRSLVPPARPVGGGYRAMPALLAASTAGLGAHADLLCQEWFGPGAVVVEYDAPDHLLAALDRLPGSLTGTVHTEADAEPGLAEVVSARLAQLAGRVIVNGWPTGVAVTWAMQHGGPWPATTHSGHTSVGVAAMRRFQRPVVYQDAPASLLPEPLRDANPWQLPRRVNGVLSG